MNTPLVLVANPGSASRKYALFEGTTERAKLHFEWIDGSISYTLTGINNPSDQIDLTTLEAATSQVLPLFRRHSLIAEGEAVAAIALRIVAPGSYFLTNRLIDDEYMAKLHQAKNHAPLHVEAILTELNHLRQEFPTLPVYGISDSAFHSTKPERAWNYGISLELADRLEIKRFGYHGLSVLSSIKQISTPNKTIVCHLGSGASVTAVQNDKSIDTTMGYSPLEGLIMSTRSGSLDTAAASRLKNELEYDDREFETYLNTQSGLKGLGGSSDIRELLKREETGNPQAHLAVETYIYTIQKGIGQMAAALKGADYLVFTGTVGERSSSIRGRVVEALDYLGFRLDPAANDATVNPKTPKAIHAQNSKIVHVIPAQEEKEMAKHVLNFL